MDPIEVYPFRRVSPRPQPSPGWRNRFPRTSGAPGAARRPVRRSVTLPAIWFSARHLVYQLVGVLLIRAAVLGELWPYGIAYLAAIGVISRPLLWPLAVVMAFLAYLTAGPSLTLAVVLVPLLLSVFGGRERLTWAVAPASAVLAVAIGRGFYPWLAGSGTEALLRATFEGMMAGGLAVALTVALQVIQGKMGQQMELEEWVCMALLLAGLLLGTEGLTVGWAGIRPLLSRLVILLAATAGVGAGSAAGALVGLVPGLIGQAAPTLVGAHALQGLMGGSLRTLGRPGIILGVLASDLLLSFYGPDARAISLGLVENLAVAAVFLLIPRQWLAAWQPESAGRGWLSTRGAGWEREILQSTLAEVSSLFRELANTFRRSPVRDENGRDGDLSGLLQIVAARVCEGCAFRGVCWDSHFYSTYRHMVDILSLAEAGHLIKGEGMPADIRRRCPRLRELAATVNCLADIYGTERQWRQRLEQSRWLVGAQLEGVAGVMENLADHIQQESQNGSAMADRLRRELELAGYPLRYLVARLQEGSGCPEFHVAQEGCRGDMVCLSMVAPRASSVTGRRMAVEFTGCTLEKGGGLCRYRLYPAPVYQMVTGWAQVAKQGHGVCGDRYVVMEIRPGVSALVISDGMGAGMPAARESDAAVRLMERLLRVGFPVELAVHTLNFTLFFSAEGETFATLDLALVDLIQGKVEFTKIGAAPSYLRRGRRVTCISAQTLPVGILQTVEVHPASYPLRAGDLLVMMSDGVYEMLPGEEKELLKTISQVTENDPQVVAEKLLQIALQSGARVPADDMTVLVARVDLKPV